MAKILVIQGHTDKNSFCASIAKRYMDQAGQIGNDVKLFDLSQAQFDPILHQSFKDSQPLEPDLKEAQRLILWADELVWVYPNWWGSLPAKLKGFIDRTLLPGFAFKYQDAGFPIKLLKGRSAVVIMTLDTPPWFYRIFMGAPGIKVMKHAVLAFCGITPIRFHLFGPIRGSTIEKRNRWLDRVSQIARAKT